MKRWERIESYHTCDICGKRMYGRLGFLKLRGLTLSYTSLEHNRYQPNYLINRHIHNKIDVCDTCAKQIDNHIKQMQRTKRRG